MSESEDIAAILKEIDSVRHDEAYRQKILDDYVSGALAEVGRLYWFAYLQLGDEPGDHVTELDTAVDALQTALDALGSGAPERADVAWWLGGAYAARYSLTSDGAVLDRLIDLYTEVTTAELAESDEAAVRYALARAVSTRYDLTGRRADLDRAILEFEIALAISTGTDADWRVGAHESAGRALATRWKDGHDRDDLDRAIAHWDAVIEAPAGPDPAVAVDAAYLRHDRAALGLDESPELLGDRAAARDDLAVAARLADMAVTAIGPDEPDRQRAVSVAAFIGWTRYQHEQRLELLEPVVIQLAEAAALAEPDSEEHRGISVMQTLVLVERSRRHAPRSIDPEATGAATADLVQVELDKWIATGNPYAARTNSDAAPWLSSMFPPALTLEWLDVATRAYESLPADSADRPILGGRLAMLHMVANQAGHRDLDHHRVISLLIDARTALPDDEHWQQNMRLMLGSVYAMAAVNGDTSYAHEAVELLGDVADLATQSPMAAEEIEMLRQIAEFYSQVAVGSITPPVPIEFPSSSDALDDRGQQKLTHQLQTAVINAQRAHVQHDPAAMATAVSDLETAVALFAEGDLRRATAETNLEIARVWCTEMSGTEPTAEESDNSGRRRPYKRSPVRAEPPRASRSRGPCGTPRRRRGDTSP